MSRKPIIIIASLVFVLAVSSMVELRNTTPALAAFQMEQGDASSALPFSMAASQLGEADDAVAATNQVEPSMQTTSPEKPTFSDLSTSGSSQSGPTGETMVDESALRYFASKGDLKRLKAEIARLQLIYPSWVPPTDPMAIDAKPENESGAFWSLYSDGQFAQLRAKIVEKQQQEPNWLPPESLMSLLAQAETRQRIVNGSDLGQYELVTKLAATEPRLLTCNDVDILWRVAEAFVKTQRPQRGIDAYQYVLAQCDDQQERLATVLKAAQFLPYGSVQNLIEMIDPQTNGYDAMMSNLARQFVANANENASLEISPHYVERIEKLAKDGARAEDFGLMGWYNWLHGKKESAEPYFRAAKAKKDSADISQGLALVLMEKGEVGEAEELLYPWRKETSEAQEAYESAAIGLLSSDPIKDIEEAVLNRIATEAVDQKSTVIARQFGWYASHFKQFDTALVWFQTALDWTVDDEPAAYGLALSYQALKKSDEFASLWDKWQRRSDRIAKLQPPRRGDKAKGGVAAVNCHNRSAPSGASA
ncbi:tetratricopeptide repeat protein [Cohaesibacter celericrescens]|uniref:tetratricopeptide repeat protein n=1 Tax=Cohaesibacter celericrescens TaxID=2067669 RepID=UPI0035668565